MDGRVEAGGVLDESALTGEPAARRAGRGRHGPQRRRQRRRPVRPRRDDRRGAAPMPASCASSSRRRPPPRRSCGWPTATPSSSSRSRWRWRGGAWLIAADPVRAVAVLVVATPCPLILAAPVAIVSGLSQGGAPGRRRQGRRRAGAARRRAVLLFDKTGTLTQGRPTLAEVVTASDASTPTRSCASRPRSTRSRHTSWPARSSPRRPAAA